MRFWTNEEYVRFWKWAKMPMVIYFIILALVSILAILILGMK